MVNLDIEDLVQFVNNVPEHLQWIRAGVAEHGLITSIVVEQWIDVLPLGPRLDMTSGLQFRKKLLKLMSDCAWRQ